MNKRFTVGGEGVLLGAFTKKLKQIGFQPTGGSTDDSLENRENRFIGIFNGNKYDCRQDKETTHYTLPGDWNKALEASKLISCTSLYVPGNFVTAVKQTSYMQPGTVGRITRLKDDWLYLKHDRYTNEDGFLLDQHLDNIRPSTKEEIEAYLLPKKGELIIGSIGTVSYIGLFEARLGDGYRLSEYRRIHVDGSFTNKQGSGIVRNFDRRATEEEITRYKTVNTEKIPVSCTEGTFHVEVGEGYIRVEDQNISRREVSDCIPTYGSLIGRSWAVSVSHVDIGCKKSIPVKDLRNILNVYDKINA